jgi:hypothetical protein
MLKAVPTVVENSVIVYDEAIRLLLRTFSYAFKLMLLGYNIIGSCAYCENGTNDPTNVYQKGYSIMTAITIKTE